MAFRNPFNDELRFIAVAICIVKVMMVAAVVLN